MHTSVCVSLLTPIAFHTIFSHALPWSLLPTHMYYFTLSLSLSHPYPLPFSHPLLSLPSSHLQARLLRQLVLAGTVDHVAQRVDDHELKTPEDKVKWRHAYRWVVVVLVRISPWTWCWLCICYYVVHDAFNYVGVNLEYTMVVMRVNEAAWARRGSGWGLWVTGRGR